jgi:hypothetical protein
MSVCGQNQLTHQFRRISREVHYLPSVVDVLNSYIFLCH